MRTSCAHSASRPDSSTLHSLAHPAIFPSLHVRLEGWPVFSQVFPVNIMSQTLPPEEAHRVRAAEGWLELGDLVEATKELDGISSVLRAHPDVLAVRYKIYAKMENWSMCEQIARALTQLAPEHPSGWISLSQCFHFQGRTREAYESLIAVVQNFAGLAVMQYDLACYACRLGNLEEARMWLDEAFKDKEQALALKAHAKVDPDLKEMW
jgi:hypothetical protein